MTRENKKPQKPTSQPYPCEWRHLDSHNLLNRVHPNLPEQMKQETSNNWLYATANSAHLCSFPSSQGYLLSRQTPQPPLFPIAWPPSRWHLHIESQQICIELGTEYIENTTWLSRWSIQEHTIITKCRWKTCFSRLAYNLLHSSFKPKQWYTKGGLSLIMNKIRFLDYVSKEGVKKYVFC